MSAIQQTRPCTESGLAVKVTLVASGFMTMLGGATIAPALPSIRRFFEDTPNAEMLTGMVLSTHALAILFFSPVAGWLGDRYGRKPSLIAGLAIFAVAGSSGFWLPSLPAILVGRFVLGIGISFIMTSTTAFIGDLFDTESRQKLLSRQFAATTAGGVLFMLGSGALADLDWRASFLIYLVGGLMLIPVFAVLPWFTTAVHHTETGGRDRGRSRLGPWLLAPVGAMFVMQLLFYTIPTQIPGMMQDEFGLGPFGASVAIAVMSLTMAPSSLAYSRLKRLGSSAALVALSFTVAAVGFAVLAAATQLWMAIAGLVIVAGGMGFSGPNINNWVVSGAPAHLRGRATGLLTTGLFLGQFLSPVVTQPIINVNGLHSTFTVIAGAAVIVVIGFVLVSRHGRKPAPANA